jgi:hypothetical protein
MRGCEVVQGHACGEGGREHGRGRRVWPQDSAPHEARSGVDACLHVGMALDRHGFTYDGWFLNPDIYTEDTQELSSMRAASSSAPSHMREGLSGLYVTIDPPVRVEASVG